MEMRHEGGGQFRNEACSRSIGKLIFGRYDDQRMGTEIRLLLCRCTVCNVRSAIGDNRHTST